MSNELLPYRNNVAAIVFKRDRFLLVQRTDWPNNRWKFPQGGIEDDETECGAIKRELNEELGIDQYRLIGMSKVTHRYDWDDNAVRKARFRWRGQFQKFFLVEFLGDDNDIKILDGELKKIIWVNMSELKNYIYHKDKNFAGYYSVIKKVLEGFGFREQAGHDITNLCNLA